MFNTVPQDERDQGWEIAGPTWVGGERNGGGIWETPSIDPELNLLYVAVANPFGDSTKRAGMNLFSDSVIALTLDTGTLKWYFQQTHHDVWDYDTGSQPTLFDMTVNGQRVKALASASKNGFLYILNRETGKPVHPIIETPVPTHTDTPGEQPWPTQPIPHTAKGKMMEPASPVVAVDIPPEQLTKFKIVPMFTPFSRNQIHAPGTGGGAELRAGLLQPADRLPVRQRDRPADQLGARAEGLFFGVRSDDRRAGRGGRSSRDSARPGSRRHGERSRVRRNRQQRGRLLLRVRREEGRPALEVQHRVRRVLVAVDLHGQRRTVRHRRIRRRRARPARRRSDSVVRAAT